MAAGAAGFLFALWACEAPLTLGAFIFVEANGARSRRDLAVPCPTPVVFAERGPIYSVHFVFIEVMTVILTKDCKFWPRWFHCKVGGMVLGALAGRWP